MCSSLFDFQMGGKKSELPRDDVIGFSTFRMGTLPLLPMLISPTVLPPVTSIPTHIELPMLRDAELHLTSVHILPTAIVQHSVGLIATMVHCRHVLSSTAQLLLTILPLPFSLSI